MLRINPTILRERLMRMPMVRALPALIAGILLADHYVLPLWFTGGGFLLCGIAALLTEGRTAGYATLAATLLFGMTVTIWGDEPQTQTDVWGEYEVTIRETLSEQGRRSSVGAHIRAERLADSNKWLPSGGNLLIRCDSTIALSPGDNAIICGVIYPFTERSGGYGRLMTRRGYVGTLYLNKYQVLNLDTTRHGISLRRLSTGLHEGAVMRLNRLQLSPDEQAIVNAMTAGDRRTISATLRDSYSRSGTSHLLAVSGLHVGIVFMLTNLVLWWMPLLRRGHITRNILVILLIWLYAATTGFPPSVIRATLMFSILQFALATSSEYISMNTLCGTAFVMLLFRTDYLFDISFQLSFLAVGGIITWGIPLTRLLRSRVRVLNALSATLSIGITAAVVTAPLISYTFGQVSIIGLLLNPIVVLIANLLVGACTIWMLLPLSFLQPVFSPVIGWLARLQNLLIEYGANLPHATIELRLSGLQCGFAYALFILATLFLWSIEREKSVHLPSE